MQSELLVNSREINIEECGYPYKFSVVVPVYNTEQYLEETLESVVNQTIGFEDNIQLILVNNATEDNAGEICERYRELYPENVVYINLEENVGPSGARNAGIPYVRGKYVNFLDSDDKWELAAFERVYRFFCENPDEMNAVACRVRLFDAGHGYHALDFRFKKTRVVNVYINYDFLQLHVNSVFFSSEVLKRYQFDINMNHAEDTKFFNQVMLESGRYGVLRGAVYNYRKREAADSLLNTVQADEDYYTDKIEKSLGYFVEFSLAKYGRVIPYIQNMIIYALKYRIAEKFLGKISPSAQTRALELMHEYLQHVSTKIILEQKGVYKEHKLFALSLKYNSDVKQNLNYDNGNFFFWQYKLFSASARSNCAIVNIEIKNNSLCLDGRVNLPLDKNKYCIYAITNLEERYPLNFYQLDDSASKFFLGVKYHEVYGFRVEIPLEQLQTVKLILEYSGKEIKLSMGFWLVTKLTEYLKNAYCVINGYIISYTNRELKIEPKTNYRIFRHEIKSCKELFKKHDYRTMLWRNLISLAKFFKHLSKKEVWLFMDTFSGAEDNAEELFKYVNSLEPQNIKPIFCVSKNSPKYNFLKTIGKVIPYDTKKYRLTFATCDKIISSQTFYNTGNTFYHRTEYLKDLFNFKFIYLQHGVIKDNHADTQSKHKKALDMFVTSGLPEYQSLLHDYYGYDESVVKLTGLARYDAIYAASKNKNKENIVLLAPTWRKMAGLIWDETIQRYCYNENFHKTDFFMFYNSLMTDKRIIACLEENDYYLEFQLHPRIWEQHVDFTESSRIKIQHNKQSLECEISRTSLLITDYSSIAFDYAYANIPVVYTQFDKDTFYLNHSYTRGYFDYETMGFGPVCYDYESTVQAIIKAIENNCVMEDKYKQRVDNFFAYRDGKNCERIYNEILKLDKE